jgi:hypothetical protein
METPIHIADQTSTAAEQASTIETLTVAGTPGTKQQLLEQQAWKYH